MEQGLADRINDSKHETPSPLCELKDYKPKKNLSKDENYEGREHWLIHYPVPAWEEAKNILESIKKEVKGFDFKAVKEAYWDIVELYNEGNEKYKACNTPYHDLKHTIDTFLVTARLIHGYILAEKQSKGRGIQISAKGVQIGLISALLHDTGYIQEKKEEDATRTGAYHTPDHVYRSIDFIDQNLEKKLFPEEGSEHYKAVIKFTDLDIEDIEETGFASDEIKLLGQILGTADLLSQMAYPNYPERLIHLYKEFEEGYKKSGKKVFDSGFHLIRSTGSFYEKVIKGRLEEQLGGMDKYIEDHLRSIEIKNNPYKENIEKSINWVGKQEDRALLYWMLDNI